MNMSEAELHELLSRGTIKLHEPHRAAAGITLAPAAPEPKKKPKYKNKRPWCDGIIFDSQQEADYYMMLKLMQAAGEIAGFALQPVFVLTEGDDMQRIRAITYSADFVVFHKSGGYEIVDTKGFESDTWKRTFKEFSLKFPNLKLKIEKGS